jgi:hypothetical protein
VLQTALDQVTLAFLSGPVKVRIALDGQGLEGIATSTGVVLPGPNVPLDGVKLIPGSLPLDVADQLRLPCTSPLFLTVTWQAQ